MPSLQEKLIELGYDVVVTTDDDRFVYARKELDYVEICINFLDGKMVASVVNPISKNINRADHINGIINGYNQLGKDLEVLENDNE